MDKQIFSKSTENGILQNNRTILTSHYFLQTIHMLKILIANDTCGLCDNCLMLIIICSFVYKN
jgi:hypothetical protein